MQRAYYEDVTHGAGVGGEFSDDTDDSHSYDGEEDFIHAQQFRDSASVRQGYGARAASLHEEAARAAAFEH